MAPQSLSRRARGHLGRSRLLRARVTARRHRGLRDSDLFVASFPRSGNTWIRFLLADLATGDQADFESIERLIPAIGNHRGAPDLAPGARLIKTHEPYRGAYKRAVYILRDARDVLISRYRIRRPNPDDLEDLDRFVREFGSDASSPFGSWPNHVRSWLEARDRLGEAILIERFESLRRDPAGTLSRVGRFVGIDFDEQAVERVIARNSPEAMQRMEWEASEFLRRSFGFMSHGVRSGSIGGWREVLSDQHLRVLAPVLELNRELGYD